MKVYDISQEVFGCEVFAGDPAPERKRLLSISDGAVCNLSAFSMCAHNGTHIDAPYHFFDGGRTVDMVDIDCFVGYAWVAEHHGALGAADAGRIFSEAQKSGSGAEKRILIKGDATVTEEAAEVFAERRLLILGNEAQTVGPKDAPMKVHRIMLGAGTVLLEGIRLGEVPEGRYILDAAPINLGGADGAPCRAVLISI
ncbi:MAG: cyclase family protein [Oscillospiraceae bacterium]|nr:cyclase family protein [Oscillospiraceae bacterium]